MAINLRPYTGQYTSDNQVDEVATEWIESDDKGNYII